MKQMRADDLRSLNLNLLVALDALLAERNVTRAARRLSVGQSAMSAMLAQIRHHFRDELLTRAADGMRPTPRAIALEEPLRAVLRQIRMLLSTGSNFEVATAQRTFRIAFLDGVETLFVPALLAKCRAEAPDVRLEVVTFDREGYASDLDADRLDVAVGFGMAGHVHHKQRKLYRDSYVVLFNPHLVGLASPIRLKDYVRIPHVAVRYRGTPGSAVDDALAAVGAQRRVVAWTPRFLVLPELVAAAPVLATTSTRLAASSASRYGLAVSPVPVKVDHFTANMVWHASYDTDPAHRWLRESLLEIAEAM